MFWSRALRRAKPRRDLPYVCDMSGYVQNHTQAMSGYVHDAGVLGLLSVTT